MTCSICLDTFKNPVVTPCGHVFCLECLIASSQKSPDATKAPCPTCRTQFSLVTPNAVFVPEKYRSFIDSNIRRIYPDSSTENALQEQVAQLQARVKSLETQKEQLMSKCESYMQAATSHAEGEKNARIRCAVLQKELKQANHSVATLVQREVQRARLGSVAKSPNCTKTSQASLVPLPSTLSGSEDRTLHQKRLNNLAGFVFGGDNRPMVPLPKRRRVSRPIPALDPQVLEAFRRPTIQKF